MSQFPHFKTTSALSSREYRFSKIAVPLLGFLLASCSSLEGMRRLEVDFEYVVEQAKDLSNKRYRPQKPIPKKLSSLRYDGYQKIRFNNHEYLWMDEGLPFAAGFFHLGYLFQDEMRIHEFTATHEQHIRYSAEFFEFEDKELAASLPSSLDYAGFRISTDLKDGENYSEIASFLGASYFRSIGFDQRYGASARGIAINSGLSDSEEFPQFKEIWMGKPLGNAKAMVVYALMDGPSVTGAYQFTIRPGEATIMDVKLQLFFRESVKSFGLAPITSMFWRGENRLSPEFDYRPEVHDSDGLIIMEGDSDPIWRPLDLSSKTRLSYFATDSFRGYGLMQRDRSFENFQDLEAEYHRRPSVWIEAKGEWGPGDVKLIELPTYNEFDDNIVTFWEPAALPEKGSELGFEYSIHWTNLNAPKDYPDQRVVATRIGNDQSYPGTHVFVIDFKGTEEKVIPVTDIVASASNPSALRDARYSWNPYTKSWRATLRVDSIENNSEAMELKCQLVFEDKSVSEVWAYQWTR